LGNRRWGVGNIKNARGAGDRGGVGRRNAHKKHNFTYLTAKHPEEIRKHGFTKWMPNRIKSVSLQSINAMLKKSNTNEIELSGYKVLSNGTLEIPAKIKADSFSAKAIEKIKKANGEAITLKKAE
jgi:ribosomal protein L15